MRAIYGGEGFWRADQTDGHRHGAGAVLCAALQHRAETTGPGEPLKIYPVSDLVNSPKTDDARCIEPVAIDRDFFERQWWGDS